MELESQSTNFEDKREKLTNTKEDLKKAEENSTQPWVDSRLIDELKRQKSSLSIAETKDFESKTIISDLEAELEETELRVKLKKDKELDARKAVEELNQAIEKLQKETETLKSYNEGARLKKVRLKQVVKVKRQRLRSSQLSLVAVNMEIEARNASKNEAIRCASFEGAEVVRLSHEEYEALKKRAEDENALVIQVVSAVEEEKVAAEASRDLAMNKWKELKKKSFVNKRGVVRVDHHKRDEIEEDGEEEKKKSSLDEENKMVQVYDPNINKVTVNDELDQQRMKKDLNLRPKVSRREKPTTNKKKKKSTKKKKKETFFFQMSQCFVLSLIKRLCR